MQLLDKRLMLAAIGAALVLTTTAPASAETARTHATTASTGAAADAEISAQRRGWRHGHGYHRHRHYGGGAALGFGLATGALIGGALAAQPRGYYAAPGGYYGAPDGSVEYCMNRFKSYDPASGTYLGYDGYRHPCP